MAAMSLALTFRLGVTWQLALWLPLAAALLTIIFLDIDHFWVPDVITFPAMAWALAGALVPGGIGIVSALLGLLPALGLWAFAAAFERLTGREGMGLGDIKLLAVLGLALGPQSGLIALMLAAVQGSVVGVLVLVVGGHKRVEPPPAPSPPPAAKKSPGSRTRAPSPSVHFWRSRPTSSCCSPRSSSSSPGA